MPGSARDLTEEEWWLVKLARSTIDANTDAGPDEDGVHTMGAASVLRTGGCSRA
jgi:cytidine deaminase